MTQERVLEIIKSKFNGLYTEDITNLYNDKYDCIVRSVLSKKLTQLLKYKLIRREYDKDKKKWRYFARDL